MIGTADQRRARRLYGQELPEDLGGRIRPGHQVRVIDLSACGLLVETSRRLLPGTTVELAVEHKSGRHVTRALVVRCYVSMVLADTVTFRGALAMEQPIAALVIDDELSVAGG
jgi:hypothetical protein